MGLLSSRMPLHLYTPPLHPSRFWFLDPGKLATWLTMKGGTLGSSCAIGSGARDRQQARCQSLLTGWIMSEVTSLPTGQACVLPSPGERCWTRVMEVRWRR